MSIRLGDLNLNVRDKSYAKMSVVHVNGLWTLNCFFLINIKKYIYIVSIKVDILINTDKTCFSTFSDLITQL